METHANEPQLSGRSDFNQLNSQRGLLAQETKPLSNPDIYNEFGYPQRMHTTQNIQISKKNLTHKLPKYNGLPF
jgi:hypothetical protein